MDSVAGKMEMDTATEEVRARVRIFTYSKQTGDMNVMNVVLGAGLAGLTAGIDRSRWAFHYG